MDCLNQIIGRFPIEVKRYIGILFLAFITYLLYLISIGNADGINLEKCNEYHSNMKQPLALLRFT